MACGRDYFYAFLACRYLKDILARSMIFYLANCTFNSLTIMAIVIYNEEGQMHTRRTTSLFTVSAISIVSD